MRSSRLLTVTALSAALVLTLSTLALADNVKATHEVNGSSNTIGSSTVTNGGSFAVDYYIQATGGCSISEASSVTISVTPPAYVSMTPSTSMTFTTCGSGVKQARTFTYASDAESRWAENDKIVLSSNHGDVNSTPGNINLLLAVVDEGPSCEWSPVLSPINAVTSRTDLDMSAFKEGRGVVPVKFNWMCDDVHVMEFGDELLPDNATIKVQRLTTGEDPDWAVTDEAASVTESANTGTHFRFSDDGHFIYNLALNKKERNALGVGTYRVTITAASGQTGYAFFGIGK